MYNNEKKKPEWTKKEKLWWREVPADQKDAKIDNFSSDRFARRRAAPPRWVSYVIIIYSNFVLEG